MPQKSQGARKYLAPATVDKRTGAHIAAQWIIRDGSVYRRTGCAESDIGGADKALEAYLIEKHAKLDIRAATRSAAEIPIVDVLNIYAQDVAPTHARPHETAYRIKRLGVFWNGKMLSEVTGITCRAYTKQRGSQAAAWRELADLRAAVNFHRQEGYCTEVISVVLPEKSQPRERWLTRSELAKMIWKAYRYREVQKGCQTGRRSRRHIARFLLVAAYTGTRSGAICSASFEVGPGRGFIDLETGVFHRRRQGARETTKRQTPVRLPSRLVAHLRRWHTRPEPPVSEGEEKRMIAETYAVEWLGKPVGTVKRAFKRVALDAGLSIDEEKKKTDVTPHILRHTAATWAMQAGMSLEDAADLLGMSVEVLRRVYYHFHPDFQRDAAEKMGRGGRRN